MCRSALSDAKKLSIAELPRTLPDGLIIIEMIGQKPLARVPRILALMIRLMRSTPPPCRDQTAIISASMTGQVRAQPSSTSRSNPPRIHEPIDDHCAAQGSEFLSAIREARLILTPT